MKASNKKIKHYSLGTYTICYLVMAFVIFICVFPMIWLLLSSFKTNMEVLESAFSLPKTPSLRGYKEAMEISKIHLRYGTSITVSGFATLFSLIIYAMAGYGLARFDFKGRGFVYALLLSSLLVPGDAMIQPIYGLINKFGLYDTKTALIIVYTAFAMPTALFLLRSSFIDVPREMEEAAYVEGSGFGHTFLKIMIPLVQPALIAVAVLTFIGNWNELLYALLLTSSEKNRTLPLMLKYFTSSFSFNYPAMFAAMVMYIGPSILIYVLLQEQIMSSMVAGAIKG
jgi:raffinose/stachyose/melibiose transport system permease protein